MLLKIKTYKTDHKLICN